MADLTDVMRLMRALEIAGKRVGLEPSKVLEVMNALSVAMAEVNAEHEYQQARTKTLQAEGRA